MSAASSDPGAEQLVPDGRFRSVYKMLCFLGQGSFGKVLKCVRVDDRRTVAVKLIKNKDSNAKVAKQEIAMLRRIRALDSGRGYFVEWNQSFTDDKYICLEFERLDKTLWDLLKERSFRPLRLMKIRPVVRQLAGALDHLKAAGIIHADLKLQNVMLVNQRQEPFRVKVIDFSSAQDASAAEPGLNIQTLPYRSPEIILGLPYTEAIDMWSLGCVASYLFLGVQLYPGQNEYDMVRYMESTQGRLPDELLSAGLKTSRFFWKDASGLWNLKIPEQFHRETGVESKENRRVKFSSLDGLLHFHPGVVNHGYSVDEVAESNDVRTFVDMVKGMLHLDAAKRTTPRQLLEHRFTTMRHIETFSSVSAYAKTSFHIMAACQSRNPAASSSGVHQENPPPRAERRSPDIYASAKRSSSPAGGGDAEEELPEEKAEQSDGAKRRRSPPPAERTDPGLHAGRRRRSLSAKKKRPHPPAERRD